MTSSRLLNLFLLACLPRYWRRWVITCLVLAGVLTTSFIIDATRSSAAYEAQIGNGTGSRGMTTQLSVFTIVALAALLVTIVFGFVWCCYRKSSDRRQGGVVYAEAGLLQRLLGRVRPVYVPFAASGPVYSASDDMSRFGRPRQSFDHLLDD